MNKKKVCLITQEFERGATWTYSQKIAQELEKMGIWEPHLISAKKKKTTPLLERDVEINLISTPQSRFFYSRAFWKKSNEVIKKVAPTIIHGNMNMLSTLGIKEKIPIVETVHTTFSREKRGVENLPVKSLSWVERRVRFFYPYLRKIENNLLKRAVHLIAVSNEIKNELINFYSIDEDKISIVPTAVDSDLIRPTDKKLYLKEENEFVLGFLARMTAGKGAHILFQILKEVKKKIPKVKLLTAGDDLNSKSKIVKQIKELDLARNVIDFGYIYDIETKNSFFSSLDLFLQPSSHEGMSLALLEALACGTPILSTQEAVTFDHNDTILLAKRTIDDFAMKILDIYNEPQILLDIKQKSRNVALEYNWKKTAGMIQDIYEQIYSGFK